MQLHPHLHCVVPGGGLTPDGSRWIPCRHARFFLPVRVLSRLFRGKMLALLRQAHAQGALKLPGRLAPLQDPIAWSQWLATLQAKDWAVYAKPPFGGPRQVLKYLARYTHRVAIANSRLVSLDNGQVTFRWKDRAQGDRERLLTLAGVAFLRRFLLHLLPSGFVRIRHYGFLANRVRAQKLALVRARLGVTESLDTAEISPLPTAAGHPGRCPECQTGCLI